jgi:hypothetical protein
VLSTAKPLAILASPKNTLRDCELTHVGGGTGASVVEIRSTGFSGYGPKSCKIIGGRIVSNVNRYFHVDIGGAGGTEDPKEYLFHRVEFLGANANSKHIRIGYGGQGGKLSNCDSPYRCTVLATGFGPTEVGCQYADEVGLSIGGGSGNPRGVVWGERGQLYARSTDNTPRPIFMKNNAVGVDQNWTRLETLGGMTAVGDVSVTGAATDATNLIWAAATADRYYTAWTPGGDPGWKVWLFKDTAGTVGKVGFKNPGGTILAEIPAANKGHILAIWDGASWHAYAYIAQ